MFLRRRQFRNWNTLDNFLFTDLKSDEFVFIVIVIELNCRRHKNRIIFTHKSYSSQ